MLELTERGWRPQPDGGYRPIERATRLAYDEAGNLIEIDGPRKDVADRIFAARAGSVCMASDFSPDGDTLSWVSRLAPRLAPRLASRAQR